MGTENDKRPIIPTSTNDSRSTANRSIYRPRYRPESNYSKGTFFENKGGNSFSIGNLDIDSTNFLKAGIKPELGRIVKAYNGKPGSLVEIQGNASLSAKTGKYSRDIGNRRALSLKENLVQLGIPAENIVTRSMPPTGNARAISAEQKGSSRGAEVKILSPKARHPFQPYGLPEPTRYVTRDYFKWGAFGFGAAGAGLKYGNLKKGGEGKEVKAGTTLIIGYDAKDGLGAEILAEVVAPPPVGTFAREWPIFHDEESKLMYFNDISHVNIPKPLKTFARKLQKDQLGSNESFLRSLISRVPIGYVLDDEGNLGLYLDFKFWKSKSKGLAFAEASAGVGAYINAPQILKALSDLIPQ